MLGFGERGVEAEKLFDAGGLQGIEDAIVYADQGEGTAVLAVIHVSTNQRADPSRVDVADRGEVDDEGASWLSAESRLELEKRSEYNGALQAKNALTRQRTFDFLDGEWLL